MATGKGIVLRIDNLETFYGKAQVLMGISLKVFQNNIISVVGSNGSGKTTLLKTICGFIRPAKGKIEFLAKEIQGYPPEKIVNLGISMVAEGRELFANMIVLENLELAGYLKKKADFDKNLEKVFSLFPILKECVSQLAGTLSGGQQQMLAIGMALMANPKLLLLDEPSLGLAPIIKEEIFHEITKISREEETTILLVEQNVNMALSVCEYGYILEMGKIVLEDKSGSLLGNELVRKAYLGQ